jgi:uncharacterized protein YbjT (DUF2867 family)
MTGASIAHVCITVQRAARRADGGTRHGDLLANVCTLRQAGAGVEAGTTRSRSGNAATAASRKQDAPMNTLELIGQPAVDALRGGLILLAGASGNNGGAVLRELLGLGLKVRAMSRGGSGKPCSSGPNLEWVRGDVTDPATLGKALAGVEIVISAVATARPFGRNRPETVDYQGTVNLAQAARQAGARRFVIITSSVSGRQGGLMNLIGRNVLVWKGRAEEALIESGLEYVVVGPARMNAEPGGKRQIRVIPRADYRAGMSITREDLASVVVGAAGLPAAANRSFSVINTDAPADATWRDDLARMPAR